MDIVDGKTLPNKAINLGEKYGEIPLVTIGDCAFPRHSWLLKPYPDTTRNEKEKLFNLKLRSARVTTENCYGMLKSRFRIIYKEIEVKKHNLRYVIMATNRIQLFGNNVTTFLSCKYNKPKHFVILFTYKNVITKTWVVPIS